MKTVSHIEFALNGGWAHALEKAEDVLECIEVTEHLPGWWIMGADLTLRCLQKLSLYVCRVIQIKHCILCEFFQCDVPTDTAPP